MKRVLIFITIYVSFSLVIFGQEKTTKYYNATWKELKKNKGKYVREITKINDSVYFIQDFLKDGMTMEMRGYFNSISPYIENGPMEYFDKSGNQIMKGKYCNGELCGKWIVNNYIGNIQYAELDYNFKCIDTKSINRESSDSIKKSNDIPVVMPIFPGGEPALLKFVNENIVIPYSGFRQGISGTVYIQFVVNEQGKIETVNVVKSCFKDYDKEATRVVRDIPDWKPGERNGEKVKVSYTLPITFNAP